MRLSVVCANLLFALVLTSCTGSSHSDGVAPVVAPAARTSASRPDDPLAGLQCAPARAGYARSCQSGHYEISGTPTDCNEDTASLGSVTTRTQLLSRFPSGTRASPVATLSKGQLVCIQYSARSDRSDEGWSYVIAIDAAMVTACGDRCSSATAPIAWAGHTPAGTCSPTRSGYSAACASGWMRTQLIDAYAMGLSGGDAAALPDDSLGTFAQALPGVTINNVRRSGASTCVAGARSDDLGRETAFVAGFVGRSSSPAWTSSIPHDPDFYQNRATDCACTNDRCYALVATDTQSAQSLSQTLLSIVRISRTGTIAGTRELDSIPGAPANATAWVEPGGNRFTIARDRIVVQGQWRASDADDAHPFTKDVPLF